MDELMAGRVLGAWDIPTPYTLTPSQRGTNNVSWRIESTQGCYILRLYQNTADAIRIGDEHRLLRWLRHAGLSFAVPCPVPARSHALLIAVGIENKGEGWAALFPVISGYHALAPTVVETQAAGAALGELDAALAVAPRDLLHPLMPAYGDLDHIHPFVPDPVTVTHDLSLDDERHHAYGDFLDIVRAAVPTLYETLPRQVIHSDYGRSNVLMEDDRVSGILDFEFAARDLRALDFAIGLYHYSCASSGCFAVRWDLIAAFGTGYRTHVRLLPAEVQALPALVRLRRAVSTLHWIGRWRQGLADRLTAVEHVYDTLDAHRWLLTHDQELVERLQQVLQ